MRLVHFVLEKKNMLSSLDRLDYLWMHIGGATTEGGRRV